MRAVRIVFQPLAQGLNDRISAREVSKTGRVGLVGVLITVLVDMIVSFMGITEIDISRIAIASIILMVGRIIIATSNQD